MTSNLAHDCGGEDNPMAHPISSTRRAAQYVRMSTERQDYSLDSQMATNGAYALEHGLSIVRTYRDAGISGLSLNNRDGLKELLADVLGGRADFDTVLVYDVSRWGRFQNPDQAAHYEFICSEAGVQVAYCAEAFENDGSPTSALLKHLKRAMAAEYSRDLSQKVSRAQRGLLAEGFWTGGRVPFGYERRFVRRDGSSTAAIVDTFMRKQQGVRTKLILGTDAQAALIRRIFRLYLRSTGSFTTVSRTLSRDPTLDPAWGKWSPKRIADTLRNPIYIGRFVGGRRIRGVGATWGAPAPPEQWVVADNAAPAIISEDTFLAARRKRLRRAGPVDREAALEDLQRIAQQGDVSQRMLRLHGKWSVGVYTRLFGSITAIREMLGVPVPERYAHLLDAIRASNVRRSGMGQTYSLEELRTHLAAALAKHGRLSEQIIASYGVPNTSTIRRRFGSIPDAYRAVGYEPSDHQKQAMKAAAKRVPSTFR